MKKIFLKNKWLLLILAILLFLVVFSAVQTDSIDPENGQMDLSRWDFQRDGNIRLDGQWEFYWQQLFTYNDFVNNKVPKPYIAQVPKAWTEFKGANRFFSGQGFATYRLHIKTGLAANELLSLKIDTFSSAYKLFINDKEIASNGTVAAAKENYTPQYKPVTAVFAVPSGEFDIIIQVANFDYNKGGFWKSIYLGSIDGIKNLQDILLGEELFIIGALALSALYTMIIIPLNRPAKMNLYFVIVCLLAIVTFDVLGELILCRAFPKIPFNLVVFLWYIPYQWLPFFYILYVRDLFRMESYKIFIRVFGGLTMLLTLLSVFTPVSCYTRLGRIGDYLVLLQLGYAFLLAISGLRLQRQGAGMYILATLVMLLTAIHDFLYNANIINSQAGQIAFVGFFIVLLVHILIHAKISLSQYNEKSRLLTEVQNSKETAVLNERKFLLAQIKPHFIYNALSVIASICTKDPNEARRLVVSLGEYLRNSFDFSHGDDSVPIHKEIELVEAYVDIEKARFGERIQFEMNYPEDLEIYVPRLSIQPLVENAIRHGILKKAHGGRVAVNIWVEKQIVTIEVSDEGFGIQASQVEELLNGSEEVKGVGLRNINTRLIGLYGKGLFICSEPGKGTTCGFEIPMNVKAGITPEDRSGTL